MLTNVNFSCGHSAEVNLSNNEQKRLEKINELELNGLCPDCRKAEWEKVDEKNSVGCACVLISVDLYEKKFSHCKERLTNCPAKDKGFTYIFIPLEELAIETLRKYIEANNVPFDEAMAVIREKFSAKYPSIFNKLQPVSLDDSEEVVIEPVEKAAEKPVEPLKVKEVSAPAKEVKPAPAETTKADKTNIAIPAAAPKPVEVDDPYEDLENMLNDDAVSAPVVETVPAVTSEPTEVVDDFMASLDKELDDIAKEDLEEDISEVPASDADLDAFLNELDALDAPAAKLPDPPVVETVPEPVISNKKAAVEAQPAAKPAASSASSDAGAMDDLGAELDDLLSDLF